jgi:hypothetical protein
MFIVLSSSNYSNQEYDDSDNEQNMNESADDMKPNKSNKPKYD